MNSTVKIPSATKATGGSATPAATGDFRGDVDDDEVSGESRDDGSSGSDPDADFDLGSDIKDSHGSYRDVDDNVVLDYGHDANAIDRERLAAIVRRYYDAAVAGDGSAACSLMTPDFAKTVVEDYGSGSGPAYMRGNTCPAVTSLFFKHVHQQLTARLDVTAVRVRDREALVLIGSKQLPASYFILLLRKGTWGIAGLLASTLP